MADFLFSQFSAQNLRSGTDIVTTSGRTKLGLGSATYVADTLANAALFAAHPQFVGQSSNGRYFRALPVNGELPVELGGALGDGVTDDQPAIQATIAYAEAIGVRTIVFASAVYRLNCPVRTSDPWSTTGQHFYYGRPMVVSSPMVFRSTHHGGSTLSIRNPDGSERQNSWQTVFSAQLNQNLLWRGGGLFLRCPSSEPASYADRPGITLLDMTLDGGVPRGSVYTYPAQTSDGDGWDGTDKGIEVEPDRFSGVIRLIRSKIIGFRGEPIFQAGENNGEIYIRSGVLGDTNADLFQSCGTNLDIDGFYGYNAAQTFEGWSGRRGRLVNAVFEDCVTTGGLQGGRLTTDGYLYTPRRFADELVPWLAIDAEFRNCGPVYLGSWVRGRVKLTDSPLMLEAGQEYRGGLHDVDLEVISQVDKVDDVTALVLIGSSTAGEQTLSDVRIRLRCDRTQEARSAGFRHLQPVDYRGSFGPNVVVEQSSGEAWRFSGPSGSSQLTAVTDFFPCFRDNTWSRISTDWSYVTQDVAANSQLVPRADCMAVFAGTAGTYPVSLPVAGFQHGHALTVRNVSDAGVFVTIDALGAGAVLPARRVLKPSAELRLRFDGNAGAWVEEVAPPPLAATTQTIAFAPIDAAGVSGEQSVALPGAATGMSATVVPAFDLGSDFEVCAIRATADCVRFRLRNLSAVSATPPSTQWSISATPVALA